MYIKHAADANKSTGKRCAPIIIIGYSDGATGVKLLAEDLAKQYPDEKIDYAGVIDMTRGDLGWFTRPGTTKTVALPSNIQAGDNFYQRNGPRPPKFHLIGMQVTAPTTITNHLWNTLSTGGNSDHFSIVSDTAIQSTIANNAVQAWNKAKGNP